MRTSRPSSGPTWSWPRTRSRRGTAPGELDTATRHARMTAGGLSQAAERLPRSARTALAVGLRARRAVRGADGGAAARLHGHCRRPRWPSASAPIPPRSAGPMPSCCGRCRCRGHRPVLTVGVPATDPGEPLGVSYREYVDLRAQATSFDGLLAFVEADGALAPRTDAPPQPTLGLLVSDNFFDVLGLRSGAGALVPARGGRDRRTGTRHRPRL